MPSLGATVYCVQHSDGSTYVPTKADALRLAREIRDYPVAPDPDVSIRRIVVTRGLGKRELYCRLLNGEAFAAEQEDVPL